MSDSDDRQRAPQGAPAYRFGSPRSIRALAHPARLAILDALATGEELTATQCAGLAGLSPSATAYHLKLLERYGLAEAAGRGPDRRERPWRATGRQIQAELDGSTPAGASAVAAVVATHIDATRAVAVEFAAAGPAEPAQWRDAAVLSTADLWLTAEEFQRVGRELAAVIAPYRRPARPAGSRQVRVMNVVVPRRPARPEPGPREA